MTSCAARQNAPPEVAKVLVDWITPFYEGRQWRQRDEAMRSIGMASQTIMVAAKAIAYDTCPMIGFDFNNVSALIGLSEDHAIGNMIAVGRGTKPPWPKPGQVQLNEVVVYDRFGA